MIFIIEIVAVVIIIFLGYMFWDLRYKKPQDHIPAGYKKTGEINIDPVSGEKSEVYYNEETGERIYIRIK